jgi:two-component system, response regulator
MAAQLKILLGNAIKSTRSALGLSQEELAARAGLHRTYVSDVERGARNPSIGSIEKLAHALKVSVSALFERASNGRNRLIEILLVEDNPRDVELTVRAFEKARLKNPIHIVHDGADALEFIFGTGRYWRRANHSLPQVILLDLNLPKISGIEVLRQIKANRQTRDIAVVVLTASTRDRDIAECMRLGAANYIVKPVGFTNFSAVTPDLSLSWMLVPQNGFKPVMVH